MLANPERFRAHSRSNGLKTGNDHKQSEAGVTTNKVLGDHRERRKSLTREKIKREDVASSQLRKDQPMPGSFGTSDLQDGADAFTASSANSGIFATNNATNPAPAGTPGGNGVFGLSMVPNASGVLGDNNNGGTGVAGNSDKGDGMRATTASSANSGIFAANIATNPAPAGSVGGNGVFGLSTVPNASGVFGTNNSNADGWGVFGTSISTGVRGASIVGKDGIGVSGTSRNGSGVAATSDNVGYPAILGRHALPGGTGVVGYNPATTGDGVGVFGKSDSAQRGDQPAIGVWGYCPQGLAGAFSGDVLASQDMTVTGTFTAARKLFKIDHPLDPANRYLVHASVESFEMINVYSGNVTTDAAGNATVSLPDYFQAINSDSRYQLTVIGQFAQAMVATEIQNNRFAIKTDKPHVKVSWQVTGLRQDNYAKAHALVAEQEKSPVERGLFLHPKLFNEPEEKGLGIPTSRSASILLDYDIK